MDMKLFQRRSDESTVPSVRAVRYCERHDLAILDGDICETCPLRQRSTP